MKPVVACLMAMLLTGLFGLAAAPARADEQLPLLKVFPDPPALTIGKGDGLPVLIIDTDPAGTRVYDAPMLRDMDIHNLVYQERPVHEQDVIPLVGTDEADTATRRLVRVYGQQGSWFAIAYKVPFINAKGIVEYITKTGWLHKSKIGTCASGAPLAAPAMQQAAKSAPGPMIELPAGTRLNIDSYNAMEGTWLRIVSSPAKGAVKYGWLPEAGIVSDPANSCWR